MKNLRLLGGLLLGMMLATAHADDKESKENPNEGTPRLESISPPAHGAGPTSMSELVNTVDVCDTNN